MGGENQAVIIANSLTRGISNIKQLEMDVLVKIIDKFLINSDKEIQNNVYLNLSRMKKIEKK